MDFDDFNNFLLININIQNLLNELYNDKSYEYKLNQYNNNKIIFDNLKSYIDDFDFATFRKQYNFTKKINNDQILECYFKNIQKFKYIYSEKFFYLKYPDFIIEEFKLFNKKNILNMSNIQICNFYDKLSIREKENIIISVSNFYKINPTFNCLLFGSDIYTFNNLNDEEKIDKIYSIETFYSKYPNFNFNIYKILNEIEDNIPDIDVMIHFIQNYHNSINKNKIGNKNNIYSINSFLENYSEFNINIFKSFYKLDESDELVIIKWIKGDKNNLVYNINTFLSKYSDFDLFLYKTLNYQLLNYSDNDLIIYWLNDNLENKKVYSVKTFYEIYPYYKDDLKNTIDVNIIISYFKKEIYEKNIEDNEKKDNEKKDNDKKIHKLNNIIRKKNGRDYVSNINEVLIDLEQPIPKLEKGISLIIRAKNEESNIKECIESVVDLVDEIIFVDNGSTDNTFLLMTEYEKKYNNIFLYKYDIKVSKVGIEHQNALKNNDKNTLGHFYNWCLSKSNKNIVFKWDADFICIRNNFIELVNLYNLRNIDENLAIWFTGKTLFINNNQEFYLNYQSFYNEYRIFSYKHGFKWYDGNICEYTEPYLKKLSEKQKIIYHYPLFYEMKRTTIDEFSERSSMIDSRDINDYNIINKLKNEMNDNNLIKIDERIINCQNKIIIFTPSLTLGGGNQFILNIYYLLKNFGCKIKIVPMDFTSLLGNNLFNKIINDDIINIEKCNEKFIIEFNPSIILLNSVIPFGNINFLSEFKNKNSNNLKIYFVTHSDVAYSNFYVKKYFDIFDKIITVNNYTIEKFIKILKLDLELENNNKFFRLINYVDKKDFKKNIFKSNKKFGIISRFSEDKNIPMLLNSLVYVFKKYNEYKFYLVGTHNESYNNYLKLLIKYFGIEKNIFFEGFQSNTQKYYELFDFIILPSVSEGSSYNIIEALNFGIPVVASNVGGNHELIKNDDNGILFNYSGIRDLEMKKIYIENYNEHLSEIGYFINNDYFKENYKLYNNFDNEFIKNNLEVIPPIFIQEDVKIMESLNIKISKWNINKKSIEESIIKMIESPYSRIYKYIRNTTNFIEEEFNENIYINQLIKLFF